MLNKKNLKFIIAFLAFCLFSVSLWHCKKDSSPTAPSDAPDLAISVSPSNASVVPSNSITFIGDCQQYRWDFPRHHLALVSLYR